MREHFRNVIGGGVDIDIAQHNQRSNRWAGDQTDSSLENGDARAFATDQRARDVETVLG